MNIKIVVPTVLVLIIVGVVGIYMFSNMGTQAEDSEPSKTFIIIGYYWGFALYDENYNPIDRIELKVGEPVKIIFLNARSFSEEFYSKLEMKTVEEGLDSVPPSILEDKIMEAFESNLVDHGLQVTGLRLAIATNWRAFSGTADTLEEFFEIESEEAIQRHTAIITPDKPGVYDLLCYVVCGFGHTFMKLDNAIIVTE